MATSRLGSIAIGISAVVVAVILYFVLQSAVAAATPDNTSNNARTALAHSLVGQRVELPKTDEFSRLIPIERERTVVVLGGCNSCSVTAAGEFKLPIQVGPMIYLTIDNGDLQRFGPSKSKEQNWVIVDFERELAPNLAYDLAPTILTIDDQGKIVSAKIWP